jgi:hypothetical protein
VVGGMNNHAAGSSAGGSGNGGASRRHTRKPKCEISHHHTILLMLPLPFRPSPVAKESLATYLIASSLRLEIKYFLVLLVSFFFFSLIRTVDLLSSAR